MKGAVGLEYDGVLMSRRADLLRDYLRETTKLGEEIEKTGSDAFDLDGMEACIDRRESVLSKIRETDGLLARYDTKEDGTPPEVLKYKWLCDKLVEQIVEAEEKNGKLLERMVGQFEKNMQQNSDSIRGLNAYFQLEMQPSPNQEWKK